MSDPSILICPATCWACKFGYCPQPAGPHPWFTDEDGCGRAEAGLPPLEGNCACPCTPDGDA
jgi:hypothetical protein